MATSSTCTRASRLRLLENDKRLLPAFEPTGERMSLPPPTIRDGRKIVHGVVGSFRWAKAILRRAFYPANRRHGSRPGIRAGWFR